mgnify:CR=1 FL=1
MNYIPNIISGIRILFIPIFVYLLINTSYMACLYLFLIMGISDALDGLIARNLKCESVFGSYLDAIADKIMINTSFYFLCIIYVLPYYLFLIVLLRDLVIFAGILSKNSFTNNEIIKPIFLSKMNTFLQIILVLICLLFLNDLSSIGLIQDFTNAVIFTSIFSLLEYIYSYKSYLSQKTYRFSTDI